jgi:hypothetical protein
VDQTSNSPGRTPATKQPRHRQLKFWLLSISHTGFPWKTPGVCRGGFLLEIQKGGFDRKKGHSQYLIHRIRVSGYQGIRKLYVRLNVSHRYMKIYLYMYERIFLLPNHIPVLLFKLSKLPAHKSAPREVDT